MTVQDALASLRKEPRFVIGGVLLAIFVALMVQSFLWRPIRDRLARSSQIDNQLMQVHQEQARADRAAAYCERMAIQSLSADPLVVAHQYQEWLMKRTESLGTVSVIPLTPVKEASLGWKVPFTVEGESEIDKIAELLDEIAQRPLLHRVTYFNAQQDEGSRRESQSLRFSITLEALALKNSHDQAGIPPLNLTDRATRLASFVKSKQPFSQGYFGPPPPVSQDSTSESLVSSTPNKTLPIVDPLTMFTLIGSVEVNGSPQAWVYDQSTKQLVYLAQNEPFQFDSLRGTVLQIMSDYIDLSIDETTVRWAMGAALRSAVDQSR